MAFGLIAVSLFVLLGTWAFIDNMQALSDRVQHLEEWAKDNGCEPPRNPHAADAWDGTDGV